LVLFFKKELLLLKQKKQKNFHSLGAEAFLGMSNLRQGGRKAIVVGETTG
jgi:hypothetical protein